MDDECCAYHLVGSSSNPFALSGVLVKLVSKSLTSVLLDRLIARKKVTGQVYPEFGGKLSLFPPKDIPPRSNLLASG